MIRTSDECYTGLTLCNSLCPSNCIDCPYNDKLYGTDRRDCIEALHHDAVQLINHLRGEGRDRGRDKEGVEAHGQINQ